jgi:hypothetical protein
MMGVSADNPVLPLAVQRIDGPVVFTRTAATVWFRLAPQAWQWRGDRYRNEVITAAARVWATLATLEGLPDRTVHVRVTQRPYPAHEWAEAVTAITPTPVDVQAWRARLVATQRRMRSSTLSDTECYLGVPVAGRKAVARILAAARKGHVGSRERAKMSAVVDEVAAVLALPGFGAHLVTQADVEWLVHRSVGLGLPEPTQVSSSMLPVEVGDVATFTGGVEVDPRPRRRTITVTGCPGRNTTEITRHVAVLSLGRMEALTIPEQVAPWIAVSEQLGFAVEWSLRVKLRSGPDAARDMTQRLQMVEDQVEQHTKHHIAIKPALKRTFARATAVGDEMEQGHRSDGARYQAWIRVAVAGVDEAEVTQRVRALRNLYEGMNIDVEWDAGQHGLYREFIPGEAVSSTSHTRRGPVSYLAGAVPNLASRIGDRRGDYLGVTASTSRRAVCWDPHAGIEVKEGAGLTPIIGGLGAGKSVLAGSIVYSAALRGISTTVLDPSGPLARLCFLPELRANARHVDLLQSEAGTLSPYTAIPNPSRSQAAEDDRLWGLEGAERLHKVEELHADAIAGAARLRQQLAIDVLGMLLPPAFRSGDAGRVTRVVIGDAVRAVGGSFTASLTTVLKHIQRDPRDRDHEIHNVLHDMSTYPQSRLFFDPGFLTERLEDTQDPTLLVLTMPGLQLPTEGIGEDNWSEAERIAVPLLTLAAHYTARRIYSRPMRERKLAALDEAHILRGVSTGRALVDRLARDSRKWTTRFLLATQKCSDLEALSAHGLVREMFAGRIDDPGEARAFLTMANIPTGVGYEDEMGNLSGGGPGGDTNTSDADADTDVGYREFVMRDASGNVEVVRIDLDHQPDLYAALRTRRRTDTSLSEPPHSELGTELVLPETITPEVALAVVPEFDGQEMTGASA